MHDISEYSEPSAILVLIGNQSDQTALYFFLDIERKLIMIIRREVTYEEGENFMKENNMHFFFETSALNGINVELV